MTPDIQVRRLLLVHEDPVLADRIRKVFDAPGRRRFRIAHYTHLADALTFLKVTPADFVLVGPRPAGADQATAITRISAAFPEVPVIALLEDMRADQVERARAAGAQECLWSVDINVDLWLRTLDFCCREMAIMRELATVTARLDWLAHTDSLTGMLNRKGLERAVMAELAHCRRQGTDLLMLLVDLDDFTRINVTMGHGVGDLVLVAAARRIGESVREQDKAGRCGSDRFVIMLPDTTLAEGEVVAEKIRLAIGRDVIQAGEASLTTTASLGLACVSANSLSFDEVLSKANFVLLRSKQTGKNRVSKAASLEDVELIRPVAPGPELVRALLRGNVLSVARQPIVNLRDSRIVSHEMLIRGPVGPLHRPDNLFRYCQEQDILPAVDLRCLKKCAEAAHLYTPGTRYNVNIMPATLLQTPTEELIRVLRFDPTYGHCCLEISEQQLLGDPTPLVPRVRVLQDAGIRIAIDDVGFGNSCLEGLIMLRPQVIKIDKRLVTGLARDKDLQSIFMRMLKVAEVLGAEVVAEGIADRDDCRLVQDLGVRLGQGYLFGRPEICGEQEQTAAGPTALPAETPPAETPPPEVPRDGSPPDLSVSGTDDTVSRPGRRPQLPPAAEPHTT